MRSKWPTGALVRSLHLAMLLTGGAANDNARNLQTPSQAATCPRGGDAVR